MNKDFLGNKFRYFNKKGEPISLIEFSILFENFQYKIIKQENVGKYFVSTVWLGIDMNYRKDGPPLIFETMIFMNDENDEDKGDPCEHFMEQKKKPALGTKRLLKWPNQPKLPNKIMKHFECQLLHKKVPLYHNGSIFSVCEECNND